MKKMVLIYFSSLVLLCESFALSHVTMEADSNFFPSESDQSIYERIGKVSYAVYIQNGTEKLIGTATCIDSRGYFITASHIFATIDNQSETKLPDSYNIIVRNPALNKEYKVKEISNLFNNKQRNGIEDFDFYFSDTHVDLYDLSLLKIDVNGKTLESGTLKFAPVGFEQRPSFTRNISNRFFYITGYPGKLNGVSDSASFTLDGYKLWNCKYYSMTPTRLIQSITGGFSGAGLFDGQGRLIGILKGYRYHAANNPLPEEQPYKLDENHIVFTFLAGHLTHNLYKNGNVPPSPNGMKMIDELNDTAMKHWDQSKNPYTFLFSKTIKSKESLIRQSRYDDIISACISILESDKKYHFWSHLRSI